MNSKNKKNTGIITSISFLAYLIAYFIGQHGSFSAQIILSGIVTVVFLGLFIYCIYIRKLKPAIFMLTFILIGSISMVMAYLDSKGINNDWLVLILPLLCILVVVLSYLFIVDAGDKEKNKTAKRDMIILNIFLSFIELMLIYCTFF